eukprot:7029127-Pyramimonas_sp.AAC.1
MAREAPELRNGALAQGFLQVSQVGGGPATTTRAPVRYFSRFTPRAPWQGRPPERSNGALARD